MKCLKKEPAVSVSDMGNIHYQEAGVAYLILGSIFLKKSCQEIYGYNVNDERENIERKKNVLF